MKNIHILPTNEPSRLYKNINHKLCYTDIIFTQGGFNTNQNIYITSNEEIKDCWVLNIHTNEVYFCKGWYGIQPITKKIIITTDQDLIKDGVQAIDDDFLEWFVKNPSCEFVKVEVDLSKHNGQFQTKYGYKIIIPKEEQSTKVFSENENELFFDKEGNLIKEEPKQETLEEVAERLNPYVLNGRTPFKEGFVTGAKWQQERSYSEEEVKSFALQAVCFIGSNWDSSNLMIKFNEWFEQFKKK